MNHLITSLERIRGNNIINESINSVLQWIQAVLWELES